MEQLTKSVYECTLAVEAHMICDLLTRAGIPARVDGEYLSGAGGELPLGNTVRVRVEPSREAEAREVIADWEKEQPGPSPPLPAAAGRSRGALWFFVGMMAGVAVSFILLSLQNRADSSGVDYDGDGINDTSYHFRDGILTTTEFDRNFDFKVDARWHFNSRGLEFRYEGDDDFDGHFEWQTDMLNGSPAVARLDRDGDKRPERVVYSTHGVVTAVEYRRASDGRTVKREDYEGGILRFARYDEDASGSFERRIEYDEFGEPKK